MITREERVIEKLPHTVEELPASELWFYCSKCKHTVGAKQTKRKFRFICGSCGQRVSFGTKISIKNHYRLEEDGTPIAGSRGFVRAGDTSHDGEHEKKK